MSGGSTRWVVLVGSFVAYMFDAVEILLLSFTLPAIRAELGLTTTQSGLLATATLLGIGVSSVTVGWLADNFGRKRALIVSLVVFGVFTAALAVVPGFVTFLVLRLRRSLHSIVSMFVYFRLHSDPQVPASVRRRSWLTAVEPRHWRSLRRCRAVRPQLAPVAPLR
ncbi:MFS transporter [Lentzea sp. PSKA42]|uniref:MFS transporter n=1 Tax=Lentzea indica TaxID=2604800 RepID=A0ABX1FGS2_9PSEU|nr:MFS transporter [Lentzea indica]